MTKPAPNLVITLNLTYKESLKKVKFNRKLTLEMLSTFFTSFRSWDVLLSLDDADFICTSISLSLPVRSEDVTDLEVSANNAEPSVASEPFRRLCCWRWKQFLFVANVWKVRLISRPWTDDSVEPWLPAAGGAGVSQCNGDVGFWDSWPSEGGLLETEYLAQQL